MAWTINLNKMRIELNCKSNELDEVYTFAIRTMYNSLDSGEREEHFSIQSEKLSLIKFNEHQSDLLLSSVGRIIGLLSFFHICFEHEFRYFAVCV